jgi:putative PEP-CTERM system TPR-repeat lipoprotein
MKTFNDLTRLALIALLVLSFVGCDSRTKEQLLQEGLELKAQKNLNGAIVLFRNALEKDPNFFEARQQLGLIYLAGGQYGKAEKELEKVLLQDPANGEALLSLADARLRGGHADQTIRMLQEYIKKQPASVRAYELLGRSLAVQGKMQQAEEVYNKALALDKTSHEVRNGLVRLYAASQRRPAALALVRESIAQDPRNKEAHYLLMQLEGAAGNLEGAIAAGHRLLKEFPGELKATYLLGVLELNAGNVQAAETLAADLTTRYAEHPAGVRLRGLILYAQQSHAEAVEKLQQSLKQMPDLSGRYFLGLAHYHLKEYELALNQFQAILDSQPDYTQARLMVAQTLFRQNRFDDSRAAAELVLVAEPNNALARDILGSVFLAQGDFDRGMSEMDRAIDLAPNLADAQLKKGMFHLAQGRLEEAETPLEEAVRLAPELINSRLLLAVSHLRRQNFPKAITTLQEGLKGQAEDAVLHNYLAAAYLGQGQTEAALAELEKAKLRKPDYLAPYVNLANYYLTQGQPQRAADEYRALLKEAPNNLRALLSLASLQELQKDLPGAEQSLARAAATGVVEGYLASTMYYSRQGQFEKALEVVHSGLEQHPKQPALLELEGKLWLRQGQAAKALAAFQSLAEAQPGQGLPLLVATLVRSGQMEEAEKVSRQRIERAAADPQGYLLLADIYKQRQDYAKGLAVLEQGLTKVKNGAALQMARAAIYQAWEKVDKALEIYGQLRKEQPAFLPATFSLAALHDHQGDKRQALSLYRVCLEQDADYLPALNNLAYLYADNYRDLDEALTMAGRALRIRPTDAGIMDTLGYVLVRKDRFAEALTYLQKAAQMLPKEPLVKLHLAQAQLGLGQWEEARSLLQELQAAGLNEEQSGQVAKLLQKINNQG